MIFSKIQKLSDIKKIVIYLGILLSTLSLLSGCDPATAIDPADNDGIDQDELFLPKQFCGYDLMIYGSAVGSPRLNTIFKLNYDFTGTLNVETAALGYTYLNNATSFRCSRVEEGRIDCSGDILQFDATEGILVTNVITKLYKSTTLTRLTECTQQDLSFFR
jgi:hypothetical protein